MSLGVFSNGIVPFEILSDYFDDDGTISENYADSSVLRIQLGTIILSGAAAGWLHTYDDPGSSSLISPFAAVADNGFGIRTHGTGITYANQGGKLVVTGGTITSFEFVDPFGDTIATISGFGAVGAANFFAVTTGDDSSARYGLFTSLMDGNSVVTGSSKDNGIVVGTGNDTANMGDGDDVIVKFDPGNLTYNGGPGSDTLSFQEEIGSVYQNAHSGLVVNLTTGVGQNPYGGALSLTSVENVIGTNLADTITGNNSANIIGDGRFDSGADQIAALGGDDTVKLTPFSSGVKADGGAGTDKLFFNYSLGTNVLDLTNQANNAGIFAGGTFTSFEVFEVGTDFSTLGTTFRFVGTSVGESLSVQSGTMDIALNGGDDSLTLASAFTGGPVQADGGDGSDILTFRQSVGVNVLDLGNQANNTGVFANGTFSGFEVFRNQVVSDSKGEPFHVGTLDFRGDGKANVVQAGFYDDLLHGKGGKDVLFGGPGKNKLWGGGGKDKFGFDSELGGGNVDKVMDFKPNKEKLLLERDVFTGIGRKLSNKEFEIGRKADDKKVRVIYDQKHGKLYADDDGKGGHHQVLFAKLDKGLHLDNHDFGMIDGFDLLV